MIIYAHRGNLNGPNPEGENNPQYLRKALDAGYGVEVDCWKVGDVLGLGHDVLKYTISREFLVDKRILVHCKNVEAFDYLSQFSNIHSFYQTKEDVVFTSWGKRLYHSKVTKEFGKNDIAVRLDKNFSEVNYNIYGLITDYGKSFLNIQDKKIELLILDVDGVLTDGTKSYDSSHECVSKQFNDRDFTAIKRFKSDGVKVCFLTGDKFNIDIALKRGIRYFDARQFSDQLDKTKSLEHIKHHMNYKQGSIAYVGDDYYDLSLLNVVDYSFCPSDACEDLKSICKVLKSKGGEGVVAELYEVLKEQLPQKYPFE